ncbi:glycoside hydrolase family 36 protein [Paenibacillus sp. GCM10023252]|uniref:glycoside hydrolase family 36 protein n=1 Tax=Paenibacillus sp. GCM10023252 TaxID=3252649 RepID=UPI003611504B
MMNTEVIAVELECLAYDHQGMSLQFRKQGEHAVQVSLNTDKPLLHKEEPIPYANFHLGAAGLPRLIYPVPLSGWSILPVQMRCTGMRREGEHLLVEYIHDEYSLKVVTDSHFIPGAAVIRQRTTVTNFGSSPHLLTHLSSANVNGIASDGIRSWEDPNKIKVHYARQAWHGEGQWRSANLEELGLYKGSVHPPSNTIRFSSVGSFSTGQYLPMLVIEDMETSKVWYMQVETSTAWNMEIGFRGSWEDDSGSLYMHADGGSERFGGWKKQLLPGESYTTVPVAYGVTEGGFDEAVRELTLYRRLALKPANAWKEEFPLVYNDFMNGIWGLPTREKLVPLIEGAAKAGAEVFCIDAGWFMEHTDAPVQRLGDWDPVEERFGEDGLQGVLDYIKGHGMIPGIWLEIEMCHVESSLYAKPDEWFLLRNGRRIGGPDRVFLNFGHSEVREYFHQLFQRLASWGIGYVKNDYNDFIPGADSDQAGTDDGLQSAMEAFYSFIDEVRAKHPNLILENCGSGAMREDYAVLSHFHVQSTSDQEVYHQYPSIIQGSLAAVLPEQAGIWSYPYPLLFLDQKTPEIVYSEAYQQQMRNGEQTIFNLVNGLCGNMVLAGHLNAADDYNMKLIQEGAALYKQERAHIRSSIPVYPTGMLRIKDKSSWGSLGLLSEDGSRMLLAVWKLASMDDYCSIDLSAWVSPRAEIRQLYPAASHETKLHWNAYNQTLSVRLEGIHVARYFEVITHVQNA